MSGAEIGVAVVEAAAALVTAYKDAGAIVENIKEKRRAKGALPPSVALEEALREGYEEIEKITAKGIQRFGQPFEQGDDIAYRALQSLTIEIQASFLHHLMLASNNDNVVDFETCIDSAIDARLRAVSILSELYLRQQKRPSAKAESRTVLCSADETKEVHGASPEREKHSSLGCEPVPSRPLLDEMKEVIEAPLVLGRKKSSGIVQPETPPSPGQAPRKSSWNVFKKLHRTPSAEKESTSTLLQATSRPPSYVTSPISPSIRSLDNPRSPQAMTPPISPVSSVSSTDVLAAAGLCKGAYYIQQGAYEKGVQVSMKNMEWTCHCRKCPFATPADRDERGRARFDDNIHSTRNLRWRSLLLFKSHISSSRQNTRVYRCLICVLLGDSTSVYQGEHHLFEHLFHHQGGVLNGIELWGPICLAAGGASMGSERTFDVCFAVNPRFALPKGAFEMGVATEIVEADGTEIHGEDVLKNQWVDDG
ncbi:hypothetical protein AYL99_09633 [Fonsecaea erecta]|uniref:Uncharacterized protein n=1 Tax=Fonsecaea erecta TaxID=1367422 RepID=A0A178Z9I0_9EURO|nr:hypothetical protein AYL99_09633 [Fonsecaea erecta]OAP56454.1 hypothetical protein AYL99_09633 [Fonsecaea erecta]